MHIYTYRQTHTHMHTHSLTCRNTHSHTHIHVYAHKCTHTHIHTHSYSHTQIHFYAYTYTHTYILTLTWGCPLGVMVKAMNCGIVVREFVLQSRYYVHFRANTLGKGMKPLILPANGLNSTTTVLLGEWLWH